MKTLRFEVKGRCPLLMHNGELADPLNETSKKIKLISSKRKKTDEDYEEMARLEWFGGLYLNKDKQIIIPSLVTEAAILAGAAKDKNKSTFKPSFMVDSDELLVYPGSKNINELFQDKNYWYTTSVKIGQARVMRTRPIFNNWSYGFTAIYDNQMIQIDTLIQAIEKAGQLIGIGDYRPKFGRFEIIDYKEV